MGCLWWSSFSEPLPRKCSIGPLFVQCGVWGGGTSRMRDGEEAPWPTPPHGTRTTSSSSQASSLLSSLPCVLHLPSISKMVIVYVRYSRVCVASKIVSSHFIAVGGKKGQPLCYASMLSGNSGCAFVSKEGSRTCTGRYGCRPCADGGTCSILRPCLITPLFPLPSPSPVTTDARSTKVIDLSRSS